MPKKLHTVKRAMKILLVESDASVHLRMQQVFSGQAQELGGYDLLSAYDNEGALDVFQATHPDLVLIHSTREDKSGIEKGKELCRKIRDLEGERHTGIIFISKSNVEDEMLAVDCLEMGADDFITGACTEAELRARVKAVMRLKSMTDELRNVNHRLQLLSLTDDLTGLANMRCFNQKYMNALKNCRNKNSGLSIIMMDLDHFKRVNDSSNHLVGSFVISEVGKLIKNSGLLLEDDLAARYGGDEYIIYTMANDVKTVQKLAESIRQLIEKTKFEFDGNGVSITSSVGVCWVEPGYQGKAEDPIKAADLMLYRSKALGRNRVTSIILADNINLDSLGRNLLARHGEAEDAILAAAASNDG